MWTIHLTPQAQKEALRLIQYAPDTYLRLSDAFARLTLLADPLGHNRVKMLRLFTHGTYRFAHYGTNHRITFRLDRERQIIEVLRVRPRAKAYQGLRCGGSHR